MTNSEIEHVNAAIESGRMMILYFGEDGKDCYIVKPKNPDDACGMALTAVRAAAQITGKRPLIVALSIAEALRGEAAK